MPNWEQQRVEWWVPGAGGGAVWETFNGTNLQQLGKSWSSNVQRSDYRQQCCFIHFKVAKRLETLIILTTKKK